MAYPEVEKWLRGKSKGTKYNYRSAMRVYVEFTGLSPPQLIDEAEEDRKKPRRQRGKPEQRILEFKEWLLTEYKQKPRGPQAEKRKRTGKVGISETLAKMYCMATMSFYKTNGFPLQVKLGKARKKKVNIKLVIRAPEISKLLSVATTLRDKSIIRLMYESCQGVSEVCSLNYGDIKRYEEGDMEVWQFHVIRKKTKTEYYTEVGEETIGYLKLYFDARKLNGEALTELSPMFVKEGTKKKTHQRITPNLIENMLKSLAVKSALVTEEQMRFADMNPARPHALRVGGMSVLKLAGYNQEALEFRSGHMLSPTRQAYWLTRPDELRKVFREHYGALRVKTAPQFDTQEVKKLREMLAEKEITVQALTENGKLKIEEPQRLRKQIDQQREEISQLRRTIDGLSDRFMQEVKTVEREFNERLNDFFADYQAQMSDAEKEVELPPVGKEEILRAKQKLSKQKPKKELSFHELIYGTEQ